MHHRFKIATLLFILAIPLFGQHDNACLKLVFVGDIMGHDAQIEAAYNQTTKKYDYTSVYSYIKPYLSAADITVANLEVTLAGPPYKGYPRFSSPDALPVALKDAGFDILLTANNHSLDRGAKGLDRTIYLLDSMGVIHTGTFVGEKSRRTHYPLLIEKNGFRIAMLNMTYGTNGLKVSPPAIVNYIDTTEIKQDLAKAKAVHPDMIITTIHWGTEYQRKQNKNQETLARFLINNGTDVVVGSHPHVVQPIEIVYAPGADSTIKNVTVYSLGNFVSNQRTPFRDGGIAFELNLNKLSDQTIIKDVSYLPTWVYKKFTAKDTTYQILPAYLYNQLEISPYSKKKWAAFNKDTRKHLKMIDEVRKFEK